MIDLDQINAARRASTGGAVLLLTPTYTDEPETTGLRWSWNAASREVCLRLGAERFFFRAEMGPPKVEEAKPPSSILWTPPKEAAPPRMISWGLTHLGPSVWAVSPSVHYFGSLHAYVILCEVPRPAPWEIAS